MHGNVDFWSFEEHPDFSDGAIFALAQTEMNSTPIISSNAVCIGGNSTFKMMSDAFQTSIWIVHSRFKSVLTESVQSVFRDAFSKT